jgi:hypothetical protein
VAGDVRDYEAMEACLAGIDVVVHLAAHTGVLPSLDDPLGPPLTAPASLPARRTARPTIKASGSRPRRSGSATSTGPGRNARRASCPGS